MKEYRTEIVLIRVRPSEKKELNKRLNIHRKEIKDPKYSLNNYICSILGFKEGQRGVK